MDFLETLRVLARRWWVLVPALIVSAAVTLFVVSSVPPTYEAGASLILLNPTAEPIPPEQLDPADRTSNLFGQNPYNSFSQTLIITGDVLTKVMTSRAKVDDMVEQGGTRTFEYGQTRGEVSPIINIVVDASTPDGAMRALDILIAESKVELARIQSDAAAPEGSQVTIQELSKSREAGALNTGKVRAGAVLAVLGVGGSVALTFAVDSLLRSRTRRRTRLADAAAGDADDGRTGSAGRDGDTTPEPAARPAPRRARADRERRQRARGERGRRAHAPPGAHVGPRELNPVVTPPTDGAAPAVGVAPAPAPPPDLDAVERLRWPRIRWDAVTFLSVYVVLLFLVPSRLIVGPIGAAGTPANLWAIVGLLWWGTTRLVVPPTSGARGYQPVRLVLFCFAGALLASYAAAFLRPILPVEARAADRGMISLLAWLGVALLAADGIADRERLLALLRRLATVASVVATAGLLQFFVAFDITRFLQIPGLVPNTDLDFIGSRSDFRRVAGTAIHPIEFGVVLAIVLPIALFLALEAKDHKAFAWARVAVIGAAMPMSLSRSAFLGTALAVGILFAGWPWKRRLRLLAALPFALVALRVLVPGLVGTIFSLFTNLTSDDSFTGRTEDYARVGQFISERPVFGRGFNTFLPDLYVLLDNQYLMMLIEAGIVGLVTFVLVYLVAIMSCRGVLRRTHDRFMHDLALTVAASVSVNLVGMLTFDGLAFPMNAGLSFFMVGIAGAVWRIQREEEPGTIPRRGAAVGTAAVRTDGAAATVGAPAPPAGRAPARRSTWGPAAVGRRSPSAGGAP